MSLTLTTDQIIAMQTDAQRAYPHEGCGLLLGTYNSAANQRTLVSLRLLKNSWEPEVGEALADLTGPANGVTVSKSRRYWIDPKDMLVAQKEARAEGLSIIGVYHSHPDHVAVPSACDRALAWSGYAYIIVSVQNGSAVDLRCWQLDDQQQFQPEPLTVTDAVPISPN